MCAHCAPSDPRRDRVAVKQVIHPFEVLRRSFPQKMRIAQVYRSRLIHNIRVATSMVGELLFLE